MNGIAIVIPCKDEAPRIAAVLEPLVEFKKILKGKVQIVVVDNNSTDGTAEVAKKFVGVEVLTENKGGKKNALIAGFAHAFKGRPSVIVTFDGDLVGLRPEHVTSLVREARQHGLAVGVLQHFLRGSSTFLKNYRIGASGQRAYDAQKLEDTLKDERVAKIIKSGPGYGFDTFLYSVFRKKFGEPHQVELSGLKYIPKIHKGGKFVTLRNAAMHLNNLYYKARAMRL